MTTAETTELTSEQPPVIPWYRRRYKWVAVVVAVLVVVGIVVKIVDKVHPSGLPSGVSLSQMETSVKNQLSSTGSDGFSVKGISSVSCIMPNSWVPGKTFTCYAFSKSSSQLGTVTGTVLPTEHNYAWNADIHWLPGL